MCLYNTVSVIFIVLLLSSSGESAEPPSKQVRPDKHKNPTQEVQKPADNQPGKPPPFQVQLLETLRTIANQNKTAYEQGRADEKSWYSPSVLVNIALVIVGICYTFFACLQWRTIKSQAKTAVETLEAIKRQADIAEKSAEAANKSADVAELALKTDRPYLLVERAELSGTLRKPTDNPFTSMADTYMDSVYVKYEEFRPKVLFSFRNYGKGPALLDEIRIRLKPLGNLPVARDFTDCEPMAITTEAIGAGEHFKLETSRQDSRIGQKEYAAVCAGSAEIIAYGCLWYRDVVGNKYEVGFCRLLKRPKILTGLEMAAGGIKLGLKISGEFSKPKSHNYST